ncbi:MAG: hypothetical protein HZA20_11345 [Nitrospirae bacterium]|nr:hypothetical protein [Nitrospirota bacterium]
MKKLIIVLVTFIAGCAVWQQTGGPFTGAGYTLDLPQGWMATKNPKHMYITKDGLPLQQIYMFTGDITEMGKGAKKTLKKGMLPQEVAEFFLDVFRSDKSLGQFTVIENAPAQLAGKDGFKLVNTYKSNAVRYREIYYGLLEGNTFYAISYNAPVRYYFDKDAAAFEEIVKSFRLVEVNK